MLLSDIYRALSDDSRLRLLNALQKGIFNVQELTDILGLSQPTISHHLKVLHQAGLCQPERTGTWIYYRLSRGEQTLPSSVILENLLSLLSGSSETQTSDPTFRKDNERIKSVLNKRRDSAKAFFDSAAKSWDSLRTEIQGESSYFEEVKKEFDQSQSILELGCGNGMFLRNISPRSGVTIGVDYSEAMLEAAKKSLSEKNRKIDLRLGHLEHLPVGDESVDVAVSYMVLHHITDPKAVLGDTFRVLKSQGKIVIVELAKHNNEQMRDKFSDLWLGFDHREMSQWMEGVGFSNLTYRSLNDKGTAFLLTGIKP